METRKDLVSECIELEITPDDIRRILRWFMAMQYQGRLDWDDLLIAERLKSAYDLLVNMRIGS
ncbi:MAG: hypothetical protein AYK18_18390 [Theionarchaea archaeon DG-70]|nr:MAG: hypothetical protein AYK18_18390 [Theionarchaea archaeon DG-70]